MSKPSKNQRSRMKNRKPRSFLLYLTIICLMAIIAIAIIGTMKKSSPNNETPIETKVETGTQVESQETSHESLTETQESQVETETETEPANQEEDKFNVLYKDGVYRNPFAQVDLTEEEINARIANLPEMLKTKIQNYPEAMTTAIQYEDYKDKQSDQDLAEIYANTPTYNNGLKMPYLNQWDVRWGFTKVDDVYIALSGCGPTVLAIANTAFNGDTSKGPIYMTEYAYAKGIYSGNAGSGHDIFLTLVNDFGIKGRYIPNEIEAMKNSLANGNMIILNVKHNGIGDFTRGGHYLIVTDIDDNNQISILDPNSYDNSNKKWDADRVLAQLGSTFELSK